MKTVSIALMILGMIFGFVQIKVAVIANYQYQKDIGCYWGLADKSSTLAEKSMYIEKFLQALFASKHSDYNAILLPTPNESFDLNLRALKSLGERLKNIQTMDEKSFAYQTAIQQITAQEQGEAKEMLVVFDGCWTLANCPSVWDWIAALYAILWISAILGGVFIFMFQHMDDY